MDLPTTTSVVKMEAATGTESGIEAGAGDAKAKSKAKPSDDLKDKDKGKKRVSRPSTRKTIKAHGVGGMRTAQACDRCRAKKSRCDGKQPACSSCAAAGLECIVSDRLTRKSYPKGYTELLEEQARQLIAENARLKGALSARDEQLAGNITNSEPTSPDLSNPHTVLHTHSHEAGCTCCQGSPAVHERPVSVASSVYNGMEDDGSAYSDFDDSLDEFSDENDFEQRVQTPSLLNKQIHPAPGAFAAATAIEQMQNGQQASAQSKEQMLTSLVAAAVPRSTEETLFIPTLLARVCEAYGYASTPAKLTASALAALKETQEKQSTPDVQVSLVASISTPAHGNPMKLALPEAVRFLRQIRFPPKAELDFYVAAYFCEWGHVLPIINKNAFLTNYTRFCEIIQHGFSARAPEYCYESVEKLGALVVLVVALALLSQKPETPGLISHYDALIHEFIKPNSVLTHGCSLQSLQILALALQYCLAIGDFATCFELRGRVITMAQQLRLHRCPAAVLGLSKEMSDRNLKAFMQGERRVVFWCVYVLDVYSSLNLGVPRLLKDYEIECATPFSGKTDAEDADGDTHKNENILIVNNTKLTIFGKVSRLALCLMQFAKVLGNIMDTIFSRSGNYNVHDKALEKDHMLDCWRRDLPADLRFETDVNGLSARGPSQEEEEEHADAYSGESWKQYSKQQHLLIFLYFHAKILIYLPIISKYGSHHNVGLSMKEKLALGHSDVSSNVSSTTSIHQAAVQILRLLKNLATTSAYLLPVPLNIPREHARFSILVAKGSLDYIKGGPLHSQSKSLLLDTIPLLKNEAHSQIPSCITPRAASLFEYAVLSILGLNLGRASAGNNLRRRIINNESMAKVGQVNNGRSYVKTEFPQLNTAPQFQTLPNLSVPTPSFNHAPQVQTNNMASDNMFPSTGPVKLESFENELSEENPDYFRFDELINNFDANGASGQYVTDGSLGLVPFLNEPNDFFFSSRRHDDYDMEY